MKLNNKLMLGFQENQCSLHVMLRNYEFMYAARTLLKTWVERMAVRGGCRPLSGLIVKLFI